MNINEKNLQQSWVHSHEEDTETEMIFRPATYRFPPSRGRKSFELRPDGTLLETGIGPADVPLQYQGKWQLIKNGNLVFLFNSVTMPRKILKIVSVERNRLVVRRK